MLRARRFPPCHGGRFQKIMQPQSQLAVKPRKRRLGKLPHFTMMPLRLLARPMVKSSSQRPLFTPDLTFVHMTDIHLSDSPEAVQGFRSVLKRINEFAPDFVLSGGDQVYDAGFADHDRAVDLYKLYRHSIASLHCPIYHVIGNHDHFGHGQPHHYERHESYGKKLFLDHLGGGRRYRSFTRADWHFILLDTSHFFEHRFRGHLDEEQFEWLRHELKSLGDNKHTVIVTHVPLLTRLNSPLKGRVELRVPKLVVARSREIRRLLHQHKVRLVLQGHTHTVEQLRLSDTWYINSGAVCGRWWRGVLRHCPTGFTVVSVKKDLLHWRFEHVPVHM
jgi:3',5'-cyclic-AMP phosphodiesterase